MRIERIEQVPLEGAEGVAMAAVDGSTSAERLQVHLAVLEPGSSLPRHPAGLHQTFYVLHGAGRIAGDDDVEVPISEGWAAVWETGEQHTFWADTRMEVVIVQRG